MAYVLEVISKDGKIKYINSAKATVYCPEYAARYDDKKTAMTVAAALLRNECYRSISVKSSRWSYVLLRIKGTVYYHSI